MVEVDKWEISGISNDMASTKKFKFWCKGTSENPNFNKAGWWTFNNVILRKYYGGMDIFDSVHFEACQWTGLLDKNGREIYEGDIFKGGDYKWGAVEFYKGAFRINLFGARVFNLEELFDSDFEAPEVIGNKFENPELLK